MMPFRALNNTERDLVRRNLYDKSKREQDVIARNLLLQYEKEKEKKYKIFLQHIK
jgi:hypothetical protein